jgi:hypothetical protein
MTPPGLPPLMERSRSRKRQSTSPVVYIAIVLLLLGAGTWVFYRLRNLSADVEPLETGFADLEPHEKARFGESWSRAQRRREARGEPMPDGDHAADQRQAADQKRHAEAQAQTLNVMLKGPVRICMQNLTPYMFRRAACTCDARLWIAVACSRHAPSTVGEGMPWGKHTDLYRDLSRRPTSVQANVHAHSQGMRRPRMAPKDGAYLRMYTCRPSSTLGCVLRTHTRRGRHNIT